jgi:CTP:molybdopterin cytidylyltransferase MocA
MNTIAILTAAGRSSRMGSPKALLPWAGTTLLSHQVQTLLAQPFDRVVVVFGYDHEALAAHLSPSPRLEIVHNPLWETGRSSTFEAAAAAIAELLPARALIAAIDQPLVAEVVATLLAHPAHDQVLAPTLGDGRAGHPILIPAPLTAALAHTSRYPRGLRDLVASATRTLVPVDSPEIHLDLNTPDDLARQKPRG